MKAQTLSLYGYAYYAAGAVIAFILPLQLLIDGIPMSLALSMAALLILATANIKRKLAVNLNWHARLVGLTIIFPMFASYAVMLPVFIGNDQFLSDIAIANNESTKRIINQVVNYVVFVLLLSAIKKFDNREKVFIVYIYFALLIVMLAGGVWQIASKITGIPFPDLGMRTNFHGVDSSVRDEFGFRITSFFAEPSYFAPYLIDLIIILGLALKNKAAILALAILSIFVLTSTFSMSGAINLAMISVVACYGYLKRYKIRSYFYIAYISIIPIFIFGALIFVPASIQDAFSPIMDRFFDMILSGDDRRFYIIDRAIDVFNESTPLAMFFGHGPGTFTMFKYAEDPIEGTSNNLYIDALIENGIFGLSMILYLFYRLFRRSYKHIKIDNNSFMATVLCAHLFISSLYRADYASPRFWVLMLIIYSLIDAVHSRHARNVHTSNAGTSNA